MFRYFLPHLGRQAFLERGVELIRESGLGDVLRDCLVPGRLNDLFMTGEVHHGPDGNSGLVIVAKAIDGQLPDRVGYKQEFQTWHNAGSYWIGIDNEQPPCEASLLRSNPIDGERIELGNGEFWLAPTIRRFEVNERKFYDELPIKYAADPLTREFRLKLDPDWQWAWDLSRRIFDWCYVKDSKAITREDTFEVAVQCLSINYRLGPVEAGLLSLLGSETCHRVFGAAVDIAIVREFFLSKEGQAELEAVIEEINEEDAKKNGADDRPAGVNSSPGPKDDCPTIAPAEASCIS